MLKVFAYYFDDVSILINQIRNCKNLEELIIYSRLEKNKCIDIESFKNLKAFEIGIGYDLNLFKSDTFKFDRDSLEKITIHYYRGYDDGKIDILQLL